jgi:peptide/nickel transport system permease protein
MAVETAGNAPRDGITETLRSVGAGIARGAREFFRLAWATRTGRIGLPLVGIHAILALVGPLLAPYPATQFNYDAAGEIKQFLGPSWEFWLGTDQFGRDVLSRVMSGATSLIGISLAGAVLGVAAGTAIGMSSGYKGGKTDDVVMRIMDGMMSFPSLLLALLVLATLGSRTAPFEFIDSLWDESLVVITIAIVNTPRVARVMRSVTLSIKEMEFVQSARLRGESSPYIVFREILPNTLPTLAVEMSVRLSYAVLLVSSLGFLGMGVQPPSPDWGLMIAQSRQFLYSAPWVALSPIVAVASLVVGVNLLVDGIKQAGSLPQRESA